MKSGKQRRLEIKARRRTKVARQYKRKKTRGVNAPIAADKTKLRSHSCCPLFPDFYYDKAFICRDCGKEQLWTPRQQKWWYEEMGGDIETTAIRCRACRLKERLRKMEARRVHLAGLKKKPATESSLRTPESGRGGRLLER